MLVSSSCHVSKSSSLCLISPFNLLYFHTFPLFHASISPHFPLTQSKTRNTCKKGEDLERNDGSSERPYFMSPELHEILSKAKRPEEDRDGVELGDSADSAKQVDEVKLEEETPLHQQEDGEIQLKQQTVLKQDNEEEKPLQAKEDAEEPKEEKIEEQKISQDEEAEKKEEVKEEAEKQEITKEEKTEEVPPPAVEAEKEDTDEKKEEKEETLEEKPPSTPQE
ncbi:putative uncharacterized protein DDB_G0287113 [Plectropomus leopardus]|uniref:putative uncharacterized protein DDB_G0287113 n=1 Tax=Plectropomus leopardus TaxID=160734 RepID=UPI001C4B2E44|nr:putative uncharacterized protein DDB_G0287113 [Plectropomus leopardus]